MELSRLIRQAATRQLVACLASRQDASLVSSVSSNGNGDESPNFDRKMQTPLLRKHGDEAYTLRHYNLILLHGM